MLLEYLNNDTPHPLPNLHNTRHHRITWIPTRTNKYKYSFFPHSVNAWNKLSNLIKASPSINISMKRYTDMFRVNGNSIFKIHNPVVIKLLTRLRVGLSYLREHKYKYNLLDTPNPFCICDGKSIGSVEHYFIRCPNYVRSRTVLFEDLNRITGNLIFTCDSAVIETLLWQEYL